MLACSKLVADGKDNSDLLSMIYGIIFAACTATYTRVLEGPNCDGIKHLNCDALTIIDDSLKNNLAFDLEKCVLSPDIITSAETDIMVLTASAELIKILTSGNQCIFLDSEVNMSHQDDVTVYA
jgi:hypothetical protein